MIDKISNGDKPGEFHDATGMVGVIVRQDEVIDLADSNQFCHAGDTAGIAPSGPSRIDQQRFSAGRNE
jgi:hypothetical protein